MLIISPIWRYQAAAIFSCIFMMAFGWHREGSWVFWEGTQENRLSTESLTAARLPLHAACVARNPAWPSWSNADARLAKLCLYGVTPWRGSQTTMIFGCVFEASPNATEGFGRVFLASIISTIGPSFLTFGHLNKIRVLEWS